MVEALALIPARGGSKVIPRKNIKLLGEFPLIGYSIAAGLNANLVTRTIVSTDDHEIAEMSKEFGAEVPFLRPDEYARDDTMDLPVFHHAIKWLSDQEGYQPDIVIQLRPTSPFRPIDLVDEAIQLFTENPEATSVRGVVPSIENPFKMWSVSPKGKMTPLLKTEIKEAYNRPRQDLPPTYWQTGHIDVIRTETILGGSMSGNNIYAYHIDPRFTVDLDNPLDWQRAEEQLKSLRNEIVIPPLGLKVFPEKVSLIVLDFDGVLTDNKVYVNQRGEESVAAHRGDGMGISLMKEADIEVVILSREKNPVVKARGDKLDIPVYQGIEAKDEVLKSIIEERGLLSDEIIYIGNDVNDLPCFPLVGLSVAVADAHPEVINKAKLVLTKEGGQGAVRELCDLVINAKIGRD